MKEVTVRAAKVGRRSKEATGLGKIVKTSETLNKEQVLGIRDLTRYDPGVAVVEQGNGASGGYSIRGVDKNRVAVSVDGVAQIQAFTVQGSLSGYGGRGGSGAINEIEYENISTVEIDKGRFVRSRQRRTRRRGRLPHQRGGRPDFRRQKPGDTGKNRLRQ